MSVKVTCGAEEMNLGSFIGKSVCWVREQYAEDLGIKTDMGILVNGDSEGSDYILEDEDELEFVKVSGNKGFKEALAEAILDSIQVLFPLSRAA